MSNARDVAQQVLLCKKALDTGGYDHIPQRDWISKTAAPLLAAEVIRLTEPVSDEDVQGAALALRTFTPLNKPFRDEIADLLERLSRERVAILTDEMIEAEVSRLADGHFVSSILDREVLVSIAKWARERVGRSEPTRELPTLEEVSKALCMTAGGCNCIAKDPAHDCTSYDFETHAATMLALFSEAQKK